MPVDLQDAMKKATSLDTFMNMLNASDITNVEEEEHAGNALVIANEACRPVEVMVQVPQPKRRRTLVFPVYVKLFRCSGGCNNEPRLSHCVATKFTDIPIKVGRVSWRKGDGTVYKQVSEKVLKNHTQCECACKKRTRKSCNPKTHVWNDRSCRCECLLGHQTCHAPQVWNKHLCRCECPRVAHVCHGPGKVWDHEKCRCACWKEKCSKGYYRNPETCRCTCHKNWCPNKWQLPKMKRFNDPSTIELGKPVEAL
ncbi:balbiani ring protein 3-like isoform X2 [Dendronephthya gigantea]|nr:balbiani ring protein 3-like isoform X2 [Dendronephthya gigantea]